MIKSFMDYEFLIVGLGNPNYENTRHNMGSDCLNFLFRANSIKIEKNLFYINLFNKKILIYTSPDLMNISGKNVKKIFNYYKCKNLILVVDNLNKPLGNVTLSYDVTSGGHNGTKSIIEEFHTKKFFVVKLGVGRPEIIINNNTISDYVLGYFTHEEKEGMNLIFEKAYLKIMEIINK